MSCPTCGGGYGVHDDYTHSRGAYRPGPWEDDEPGDPCSACGGRGHHEDPNTGHEYECRICGGEGVAS